MAAIPEVKGPSKTAEAIYASYEKKNAQSRRRSRRLGASIIGRPCARQLWYEFRWAGDVEFDGRMLRLFETGHLEEIRIATNLTAIGCEVHLIDPTTKQQFEFTAVSGHVVCKIDAAILGLPEAPKAWHAGEFKTHNLKSFTALKSKGLREAKPEHYAQLGIGMSLSGMDRGLYFAVCKDNDEIYTERLRWEEIKPDIEGVMEFAAKVVTTAQPPERISTDADHFVCKFCDHNERCHGSAVSNVNCRTCVNAEAVIEENGDGRWRCTKHNKTLSVAEQAKGCDDHLYIPDLINFAKVDDAGYDPAGDWISYINPDGTKWRNSKQKGDYRSIELTQLPHQLVGAGTVDAIKTELGGVVVDAVEAGVA